MTDRINGTTPTVLPLRSEPPRPPTPATAVLNRLADLLAEVGQVGEIDVHVSLGVMVARLTVARVGAPTPPARVTSAVQAVADGVRLLPPLSPPSEVPDSPLFRLVHKRLLEVITVEPATPARICRLANMRRNSYTQTALSELVRWRYLLHTPDGYCLPGGPPSC